MLISKSNIKVAYSRIINTLNSKSRKYDFTIHDCNNKVDGLYKYTHKYTTLSKSNTKPLWFFKHHRIRSKSFSLVRRFCKLDDDRISYYNNLHSEEEYPYK